MQPSTSGCPSHSSDLGRLEQALLHVGKRVLGRVPGHLAWRIERTGYFALVRIAEQGRLRTSELSGLLELDLSTVSRQVRLLEGAGLLQRAPDPLDGRAHLLELSDAGRTALDELRRHRHAVLERALVDWPATDRTELLRLLERLGSDLDLPVPAEEATTPAAGGPSADQPSAGRPTADQPSAGPPSAGHSSVARPEPRPSAPSREARA